MHTSSRQAEVTPDETDRRVSENVNEAETERDDAGDLQTRENTDKPLNKKKPLRSILKSSRTESPMASTPSEGPRQRTTEITPITSTAQHTKDYASIPPRDVTLPSTRPNGALAQESRTSTAERSPQRRTSSTETRNPQPATSRWSDFWEKWGSVELENKGSVARDHLALERTFLAWLRTSLSFASIGIAITQLFRLNSSLNPDQQPSSPHSTLHAAHLRPLGKPLGATFIGISILMLFIGFHRYFEAQHYVIRGKFPASRGSVILVSGVAGTLILSCLVVVLAVGVGGEA